jgi:phospho-N-acetylmuramoyl-pentapeptide-transferase
LCGGVSSVVLIVISVILFLGVGNLSEVFRNEILNLIVVSFGLVGGILGFLIFNSYPAKVFMGDTGSLAIGGFLASLVSLTRQYFLVVIVGFAFVLTAMSVILQVFSYKVFKKRIIKMAPLHHHFEQTYHEVKVVAGYVILSIIVGVLTISMYI